MKSAKIFWLLVFILLLILIVLPIINKGRFVDESDNIVGGWLISKGMILYKDIFSHHMPFPYFFSAFSGLLVQFSIPAIRLFFLVLLMCMFASFLFILPKQSWQIIALSALSYVVLSALFNGHMVLYDHLVAVSLLALYILLVYKRIFLNRKLELIDWFFISLFVAVAFYSSLASIYSILILFAFFLLAEAKEKRWSLVKIQGSLAPKIFIILFFPHIIVFLFFILQGTYQSFIWSVYTFNTHYYLKYLEAASQNAPTGMFSFITQGMQEFIAFGRGQYLLLFNQIRDLYFASRFIDPIQFLKTSSFTNIYDFTFHYINYVSLIIHQAWNNLFNFETTIFVIGNLYLLWNLLSGRFIVSLFVPFYIASLRFRTQGPYHLSPYYLFLFWVGGHSVFEFVLKTKRHTLQSNLIALVTSFFLVITLIHGSLAYRRLLKLNNPSLPQHYYAYISSNTHEDDQIWLAGIDPYFYIETKRIPSLPYLFYYPWIYDYEFSRNQIFSSFAKKKASFIIVGKYLKDESDGKRVYASELLKQLEISYQQPHPDELPGIFTPK